MSPGVLALAGLAAGALVWRWRELSRPQRAAAVGAVLGLSVWGSGLVSVGDPERVLERLTTALGPYTYALVAVMAFLETGAGVGLIAPGELVVLLGGVSAGRGAIELGPLIALVWVCALAGDLTSYALGRRLGREFALRHGPAVGITAARLEQVERFFAAHGIKTILFGRFVGVVRALSPFIAGTSRMPARRFVPCTALAAALWASTFCTLGYAFWSSLPELVAAIHRGGLVLGAVAAVIAAVIAVRRRRARRAPARDLPGSAL